MTETEQQTLGPSLQPGEIAANLAKDAQENLAGLEGPLRRGGRDFGRCLLFASGPPVATDELVQRYW